MFNLRISLKKLKIIITLVVSVALVQILFQNCSKLPEQFSDSKVQNAMSFFEYRYAKPAPIYFEIQIVQDSADSANKMYKLLGFATNSDGRVADIEYSIEVFGVNNQSICPLNTATLTGGATSIEVNCVLPLATVIGYAVFKVRNPGGEWNVYTKNY